MPAILPEIIIQELPETKTAIRMHLCYDNFYLVNYFGKKEWLIDQHPAANTSRVGKSRKALFSLRCLDK